LVSLRKIITVISCHHKSLSLMMYVLKH